MVDTLGFARHLGNGPGNVAWLRATLGREDNKMGQLEGQSASEPRSKRRADQEGLASVMVRKDAFHFPEFLDLPSQKRILELCVRLGKHSAGFYQPVLRNGNKMTVRMMCLGRHWNAKTYKYQERREDVDGREVQPMPAMLIDLAEAIANSAGMAIEPDIAIVNYYDKTASLGLHQDKDEQLQTIQSGVPVVSISVGDEAEFLFGGLLRKDPQKHITLRSGDAFVFGGKSRLCFHGVSRVKAGTAPKELCLVGRYNITIRQF